MARPICNGYNYSKKLKRKKFLVSLLVAIPFAAGLILFTSGSDKIDDGFISYIVDPKTQDIDFYWKNDSGIVIGSIGNLKTFVESKNLRLMFAMNGGMFKEDRSPLGLFIRKQKELTALNNSSGSGNFYLKPNGVFCITTNNTPIIWQTDAFINKGNIKYATQSGPMLVIDGEIHPAFKQGSANLNIRNGVGILPSNRIVFAMSKSEINFYDFANYFRNLGCKNALYLDGFVSRTYLPEKQWTQTDGNFGVIIGITRPMEE